ncbi:MAG: TRAP transporter permease DctQ [Sneathiella sp.]|nr:MAG: TRAP transporter permease DctQ [Sneathiella sp.]
MSYFIRIIQAISRFFGVVSALLVSSAILVVCQMVVLRYFLNESTIWQTEYVTYAIVAATFLGSPYVLLIRGHVNVNLLPHYLSGGPKKALALIASLLALVFCAVLTWQAFNFFFEAYDGGWVTDTIWELPLWIAFLPMFVGMLLLSLQYVADILGVAFNYQEPFAAPENLVEAE